MNKQSNKKTTKKITKKNNELEERQYATRFDLVAHSVKEQAAIHEALELGFEPFAVSNATIEVKPNKIALVDDAVKPKFEMDTVIWLKRGSLVPVMTQAEIDSARLEKLDSEQATREAFRK